MLTLLFLAVLEFEKVYVDNLPSAEMYEKSYMHRDVITHVVVTPHTDFVVTARLDIFSGSVCILIH